MNTNNLYRIITDNKTLKSIKEIEFSDFNFKERYDIQEWVESNPNILGENLLIISKDLSFFNDTKERPDLIAIDENGNIVIIELKRDDSGLSLEWQAIKYASYLSKFTVNDIFNLYEKYLTKYNKDNENEVTLPVIKQRILEFIDEESFDDINKKQRLILVSHRFAKEVTSAVNWLIEKYLMDIKCVQLIPFFDKDKDSYYIQSNTILPVPGIEDLLITASEKNYNSINSSGPIKKNDEITKICDEIFDSLKNDLGENLPDKRSRWAGVGSKFRYFHLWYLSNKYWDNWGMSYRIWIYQNHPENDNKVGILYEFNKRHLLSNGLDESNFNELVEFIKDYAKNNDYSYFERNIAQGIEKLVIFDQEIIATALKELIQSIFPKLKQIFEDVKIDMKKL
ncbi:MAG TPA: hypothetical protein PLI62_16930 [Spirochaetota bacterium]|nr:hypothetical protein [Spirochaetota bacterium]HQP49114.1 hypothetical protein [Spirochaetota bacterium]